MMNQSGTKMKFIMGLIVACIVTYWVVYSVTLRLQEKGYVIDEERFSSVIGYTTNVKISEDGLMGELVGDDYLYRPAPPASDWIEVARIVIEDNLLYPVYYTKDGYQVLRKNKGNGLIYLPVQVNNVMTFFILDTGAEGFHVSDKALLNKLNVQCERYINVQSVSYIDRMCISSFETINLSGFFQDRRYQDSYSRSLYSFTYPEPELIKKWEQRDGEHGAIKLLGMNIINEFDVVIKGDYTFIRPTKNSRFLTAEPIQKLQARFASKPEGRVGQ